MATNISAVLPPTSISFWTPSKPWYFDRSIGRISGEMSANPSLNCAMKAGWDCMYSKWFIPCAFVNGSSEFNTVSLHAQRRSIWIMDSHYKVPFLLQLHTLTEGRIWQQNHGSQRELPVDGVDRVRADWIASKLHKVETSDLVWPHCWLLLIAYNLFILVATDEGGMGHLLLIIRQVVEATLINVAYQIEWHT